MSEVLRRRRQVPKDSFVFHAEETVGEPVEVYIIEDGRRRDNVPIRGKLLANGTVQLLGSYSANVPLKPDKFEIKK